MDFKKESFTPFLKGCELKVYFGNKVLYSTYVEPVSSVSENHQDSISVTNEIFNDEFKNTYNIEIMSSMYEFNYNIELISFENKKEGERIYQEIYVEIDDHEKEEVINITNPKEPGLKNKVLKYFSIKTSQEEGIKKLLEFYDSKNTNDTFSFGGLTQLYPEVELDNLVFIVAGGDKAKIKFNYTQGLYAIATVVKAPYEKIGKAYKIDIKFLYFFTLVITRDMFFDYQELKNMPNIGPMTKGEKNQAISKISVEQTKSILLATKDITKISNQIFFSLFPWVKEKYTSIATENYKSLIDKLPPSLNVVNIAEVFAKYLMNYDSKYTTTLIGIFGMWGRGKTYFFEKVKNYIISINSKEKTFYFCNFQPWKHQKRESAWAYLYQTILESYLEKNSNNNDGAFFTYLKQTQKIFLLNHKRLGIIKLLLSLLFIFFTAIWVFTPFEEKLDFVIWIIGVIGIAGMIIMYKSYSFYIKSKNTAKNIIDSYGKTNDYSNYLGFQSEIEKELSYLLQTYIDKEKEKLVLFVDDLDRCNEEMIIDIVDGLKLVLDNKEINSRLIIVTAVDERVLEKAIAHKYLNNTLPADVGTKEYIEKFFLMGIKLNQLQDTDIDELVETYTSMLNNVSTIKEKEKTEESLKKNDKSDQKSSRKNDKSEKSSQKDEKVEEISNEVAVDNISFVLDEEEIEHIKDMLKKEKLLTPRKINMFIHRYLIFKSFIFTMMNKNVYDSLEPQMLIEIVIKSQKRENLDKLKEQLNSPLGNQITLPDGYISSSKINREEYSILIKFAEMVSPF